MRCASPKTLYPQRSVEWLDAGNEEYPVSVPCGHCVACLSNKRLDWTFRLEQEHRASKSAHFVTLTYDEKHLRSDRSLSKRDLQLYLKRLRKKYESGTVRYYAVGEYGSKSGRAHYHILLFNCDEANIRTAWTDSKGNPIGLVHVGKVTPASVAYVTKYVIQSVEGVEKKTIIDEQGKPRKVKMMFDGRLAPFAVMSRRYGIGGRYLSDEMVEWHRADDRNYTVRPGNVKGRLPRFYREKIWWKPKDRERISSKAMLLSTKNIMLEEKYWRKAHGTRWREAQAESRELMYSHVRKKIMFSQTF